VRDDSANGEGMVEECDLVADFEMAGGGDNVVGDGFVGALEGTARAEEKSFAEGVKALVVNAVDNDEVFLVHQA
jgi:hypothetical protein